MNVCPFLPFECFLSGWRCPLDKSVTGHSQGKSGCAPGTFTFVPPDLHAFLMACAPLADWAQFSGTGHSSAPSPVCCSLSCIAQGSHGLSLRGRDSKICWQNDRCWCSWFSQDLRVLHISICITPKTVSTGIIANEMFKTVAYPGIFFGGGQQIQLRTEDRENGDLGAVAP